MLAWGEGEDNLSLFSCENISVKIICFSCGSFSLELRPGCFTYGTFTLEIEIQKSTSDIKLYLCW